MNKNLENTAYILGYILGDYIPSFEKWVKFENGVLTIYRAETIIQEKDQLEVK